MIVVKSELEIVPRFVKDMLRLLEDTAAFGKYISVVEDELISCILIEVAIIPTMSSVISIVMTVPPAFNAKLPLDPDFARSGDVIQFIISFVTSS